MIEIPYPDLNTLILCSFRYALGRKSYIVADIASLIDKYQDSLAAHIKYRIREEITDAIENNNYGMDMDKEIWGAVLLKLKGNES